MDLTQYDVILVNTSAGKDSQAMLDLIVELATAAGVRDRVQAVHCDLGRVEWAGTRELAERQCLAYGVRLHVVTRPQGDLLDQVRQRRMWPSSTARYCTSDHKRGQVRRVLTAIVKEWRAATGLVRACRILSALGLRAQESPARAKRVAFEHDAKASNGKRHVDTWHPILAWTEDEVWARIRASGVPYHPAYDLGMRRLSCVFCIFAPEAALMIAGQHNRELLAAYVATEEEIGHTFRPKFRLRVIQDRLEAGERAAAAEDTGCWNM